MNFQWSVWTTFRVSSLPLVYREFDFVEWRERGCLLLPRPGCLLLSGRARAAEEALSGRARARAAEEALSGRVRAAEEALSGWVRAAKEALRTVNILFEPQCNLYRL